MLFIGLFIVVICKDTKNYGKTGMENGIIYAKMGFRKEEAPPPGILSTHTGNCQPVQLQRLTTSSDRQAAVNRNQKNKKCHIVTLLQLGVVIRGKPPPAPPKGGELKLA